MVLSVELTADCLIPDEVAVKVKEFLLGGQGSNESFRDRSASTSSSEEGSLSDRFPDTESPTQAREWMPLVKDEKEPPPRDESLTSGWISLSLLATYSNMDYVLLGNCLRFVVLIRKGSSYAVHSQCDIANEMETVGEEEVIITCGDLFGLGSRLKSSSLDCVIVALGLNNGYAMFFTEKGTLLFYEKFASNKQLNSIRLEQVADSQQVTVSTDHSFFAVDPHSLHAALVQSKAAIAGREKTAREMSDSLEIQCEHLCTEERKILRQVLFTGMHKPTAFEQYANASSKSYYERAERPNLPNYSTYLTTSDKYFISFAWRDSDEREFIWNEAIKLGKSFIPHFGIRKMLGFGAHEGKKRPAGETQKLALTRGTIMDAREADIVQLGPSSLAVVVDRAARVLLIDIASRQIIRIWKGYRDAKVAFVTAQSPEAGRKAAVFLAIFVPRRALLEVWSLQNGMRVGAQHVDAAGLLISGGSSTVLCGVREPAQFDAYFMDRNGSILRIVVPYHFALMRNKSKDQHDELLLPKITARKTFVSSIFSEIYSNLRTLKGKRQAILSALGIVNTLEDVDDILAVLNKDDFSHALGHLPESIATARLCYAKFMGWQETKRNQENERSLEELPFETEAKQLIGKHLTEKEKHNHSSNFSIAAFFSLLDWSTQKTAILKKNHSDSDILSLTRFVFSPLLENDVDIQEFDEYGLEKLPFEEGDILGLFTFHFLHSASPLHVRAFLAAKQFVSYIEKKRGYEHMTTLDFLEKTAMASPNNSRALLLYAIVSSVRRERKNETEDEQKKKENEQDKQGEDREAVEEEREIESNGEVEKQADWIAYDPVLEHLTAILSTMHCACLCSELQTHPGTANQSFQAIWSRLAGYFREQVAIYVVSHRIARSELSERLKSSPIIEELKMRLPESLQQSLLDCDIAWEYGSRWFKNRTENAENLLLSIVYAEKTEDSRLRHGVARLLWEKFLDEPFKALAMLIEKTGRAPKEREAKQQLGMSESKVPDFLLTAERLLCVLLESVRDSPSTLTMHLDNIIELSLSHPPLALSHSSTALDNSLVQLAAKQSLVNYHLVLHHLHLAIALRLQVSVGMRLHPLKSLFCSIGLRAFFQPFDSHPLIPLDNVDEAVMERRHEFLNKIAEQCNESERKGARQLAAEWNLTVDSIALIQVVSLLRKGEDAEAAQEIVSVPQNERLATALIRIVAARLIRLADEEKATLTPSHSSFVCELAGEETCRVECPQPNGPAAWRASLQTIGRLLASLPNLPSHSVSSLVKLNSLAEQYFSFKFY